MAEDILTVMWKESKSILRYSSSRWKGLLTLLTPIALFGIIFPIQFRATWLTSGWSVAVSIATPLMLVATTIAESFAGERERHTLETLLASRLPDRAILFGKLLMSLIFGWGMTLFLLVVSLIVVNILEWNGSFQMYQASILGINIAASLLVSGLVSSLGILISLRSPTVQSAAQTIMLMLFMPLLLLQAVVFLLPSFLPQETIMELLDRMDFNTIMLVILVVLLAITIGLSLGAWMRFKRSKLILS
jgi:ABC-2 type transport system permease protein